MQSSDLTAVYVASFCNTSWESYDIVSEKPFPPYAVSWSILSWKKWSAATLSGRSLTLKNLKGKIRMKQKALEAVSLATEEQEVVGFGRFSFWRTWLNHMFLKALPVIIKKMPQVGQIYWSLLSLYWIYSKYVLPHQRSIPESQGWPGKDMLGSLEIQMKNFLRSKTNCFFIQLHVMYLFAFPTHIYTTGYNILYTYIHSIIWICMTLHILTNINTYRCLCVCI